MRVYDVIQRNSVARHIIILKREVMEREEKITYPSFP